MSKILWTISAIAMMFFSSPSQCPTALKEGVMFQAYNNGYQIEMSEENVKEVDKLLCQALKDSRPMPALGVSLHDDTVKATEKGIWLRFAFNGTQEVSGLQFDQLLFRVTKDMYGISIDRGNNGIFEGRNFYIDIHQNLDGLYNYLKTLPTTQNKFTANVDMSSVQTFNESEMKIKEVDKIEENFNVLTTSIPAVNKDKDKNNSVIEAEGVIKASGKGTRENKPLRDKIDYACEQSLLNSIDF